MRMSLVAALLCGVPALAAAESVVTYHNGNHRHGAYVVPSLTLASAAKIARDTQFSASLNGNIYAQPLYWNPKGATQGKLIVATESNDVYALNANTGAVVWHTALGPSVPRSELPCGNIDPVGVTGTPVIDPATGVLYLGALVDAKGGPRHRIYALSLSNGAVLPKWPLDAESAINKQGGSFTSPTQGERSALLFFGNRVYVNYAGNDGDCGTYHGTVLQVATDPPSLEAHWQTRAVRGGIWAQGGLAGDGQFLYATTGNTSGANTWSDGEAIIKLRPGLAHSNDKKDYFTPSNWQDLDDSDQDLGGTEALPLNVAAGGAAAKRVIAFGKDGKAYLADRRNLGGIGGAIAVTPVANSAIRTAPAIYEADTQTLVAFTDPGSNHCAGSSITMLKVAASGASPVTFDWCAGFSGGGAPIITTTDGKSNAIVWVVGAEGDNELHGFNALNGQTVFAGTGTAMSGLHHFQTLIVTLDRLYVAGDETVYAFKWQ